MPRHAHERRARAIPGACDARFAYSPMTRLTRVFSAVAALWLFADAGLSLAASSAVSDELLAPLTSAYVRAVKPGEQAELHRDLFGDRAAAGPAQLRPRRRRAGARRRGAQGLSSRSSRNPASRRKSSGKRSTRRSLARPALALPRRACAEQPAQRHDRDASADSACRWTCSTGWCACVAPMAGTPAARAGLQSGDLIVRFDDQPVLGMALADAISRMRGAAGHADRADDPSCRTRRRIHACRSCGKPYAPRRCAGAWKATCWCCASRASRRRCASMLEKAIADATATATPRAVVLDMRGNRGGLLRPGGDDCGRLPERGRDRFAARAHPGQPDARWQADPVEQLAGVPMVVLIDGRSASAAELVAAALQENGRATVMGQRSFGKGSVQSIVSLGADKGALRLTTALYHGPSGRTVQRTGVGPDIELVADDGNATGRARREADRRAGAARRGRAAAAESACGAVALRASDKAGRCRACLCAGVPPCGPDRVISRGFGAGAAGCVELTAAPAGDAQARLIAFGSGRSRRLRSNWTGRLAALD